MPASAVRGKSCWADGTRQCTSFCHNYIVALSDVTEPADGGSAHHETLDLPRVFSPADAVHVLRGLGLTGMTECALRTRAYRKQVPFHLNGRRITFTLGDLQEIAEGKACRPQPPTSAAKPRTMPPSVPHHRSSDPRR